MESLDQGTTVASGGHLAAAALAARDVRVDRFVLPAESPLVVDGKLGLATGLGTDPSAPVLLVGPRESPSRCAPESLLCHLTHILSRVLVGPMVLEPLFTIRTHESHGSFRQLHRTRPDTMGFRNPGSVRRAAEARLSLLQERSHALFLIEGSEQFEEQLPFAPDRLRPR